jgi:hypothetical protein
LTIRPQPRLGGGDQIADLLGLGHVGAVISRADLEAGFQIGAQGLDLARVSKAIEHHIDAGLGQRRRDPLADPAGRPRYNRRPAAHPVLQKSVISHVRDNQPPAPAQPSIGD